MCFYLLIFYDRRISTRSWPSVLHSLSELWKTISIRPIDPQFTITGSSRCLNTCSDRNLVQMLLSTHHDHHHLYVRVLNTIFLIWSQCLCMWMEFLLRSLFYVFLSRCAMGMGVIRHYYVWNVNKNNKRIFTLTAKSRFAQTKCMTGFSEAWWVCVLIKVSDGTQNFAIFLTFALHCIMLHAEICMPVKLCNMHGIFHQGLIM